MFDSFKKFLESQIVDPRKKEDEDSERWGWDGLDDDDEITNTKGYNPGYRSVQNQSSFSGTNSKIPIKNQLPRGMSLANKKDILSKEKEIKSWYKDNLQIYNDKVEIRITVSPSILTNDLPVVTMDFYCNNSNSDPEFIESNKEKLVKLIRNAISTRIRQIFSSNEKKIEIDNNFAINFSTAKDSYLWKFNIIQDSIKVIEPLISNLKPKSVSLGKWEREKMYFPYELRYIKFFLKPQDDEIDWRPTDTVPEDYYQ